MIYLLILDQNKDKSDCINNFLIQNAIRKIILNTNNILIVNDINYPKELFLIAEF